MIPIGEVFAEQLKAKPLPGAQVPDIGARDPQRNALP